jgi:hypothetical protein
MLKFFSRSGLTYVNKNTVEYWINYPEREKSDFVTFWNSLTLPIRWLLWTSKGLAGLPYTDNMRERLCDQAAALGSVAGLYVVVAITAFLVPPG